MTIPKRRPRKARDSRPAPKPINVLLLAEDFRRWQHDTGQWAVADLPALIRVERAQAAQGAVLASDAAKARIAGTAS